MYEIHYRRGYDTPRDYCVIARNIPSLREAGLLRICSGDLVVHARTLITVDSDEWLYDWEKSNPDCYAKKAIAFDNLM